MVGGGVYRVVVVDGGVVFFVPTFDYSGWLN